MDLPGDTTLPLLPSKLSMVGPLAATPLAVEAVVAAEPGFEPLTPAPVLVLSPSFVVGEPNILRGSVQGGRHLVSRIRNS